MSKRDRQTTESDDNVIILSPPPSSSADDDSDAIFVTPVVEDVIVTPILDDDIIITPPVDDKTTTEDNTDVKQRGDEEVRRGFSDSSKDDASKEGNVHHDTKDFQTETKDVRPDSTKDDVNFGEDILDVKDVRPEVDDVKFENREEVKAAKDGSQTKFETDETAKPKSSDGTKSDVRGKDGQVKEGHFKPEPSEEEIQAILDEMLFQEEIEKLKADLEDEVGDSNFADTDVADKADEDNTNKVKQENIDEVLKALSDEDIRPDDNIDAGLYDLKPDEESDLNELLLCELLKEEEAESGISLESAAPYTSISDMEKDLNRYISEIDRVLSERDRINKIQLERKEKNEQLRREREQKQREERERREREQRERAEHEDREREQREQEERERADYRENRDRNDAEVNRVRADTEAENEKIAHLESIINELIAEREKSKNEHKSEDRVKEGGHSDVDKQSEKILASKLDKLEDMLKDVKSQSGDRGGRSEFRHEDTPPTQNSSKTPEDAFMSVFRKWFEGEMLSKIQNAFGGTKESAAPPTPPTPKAEEAKEENGDLIRVGDNLYYNKKDNKTYSFMPSDANLPAVVKTPAQSAPPPRPAAPPPPRRRPAPRRRAPVYSVRPVGRRPARPGSRPAPRRPR